MKELERIWWRAAVMAREVKGVDHLNSWGRREEIRSRLWTGIVLGQKCLHSMVWLFLLKNLFLYWITVRSLQSCSWLGCSHMMFNTHPFTSVHFPLSVFPASLPPPAPQACLYGRHSPAFLYFSLSFCLGLLDDQLSLPLKVQQRLLFVCCEQELLHTYDMLIVSDFFKKFPNCIASNCAILDSLYLTKCIFFLQCISSIMVSIFIVSKNCSETKIGNFMDSIT